MKRALVVGPIAEREIEAAAQCPPLGYAPLVQAKSHYLALAMLALRRARKRAEEIAIATKTALVQVENGEVVRVHPGAEYEQRTGK